MAIELTSEQQTLLYDAVSWYRNSSELVFQYTGGPGTGKSMMLHLIIRALGLDEDNVAPMAYTGSAAIVMRTKGFSNACTIHSWLYKLVEYNEYNSRTGKMIPKKKFVFTPLDSTKIKLICVDEASTVPLSMKRDLEANGIKIVACGDLDQLHAVKDKPAYLVDGKIHYLTQIMRQALHSPIIMIASMLRVGNIPRPGNYGKVLVISKDDLTREMIVSSEVIICGTNKTREFFNTSIRREIMRIDSDLPKYGEKVVCRKNDWHIEEDGINLANGLAGTVANAPSIAGFKNGSFSMDFRPDLFPNIIFTDLRCDYQYFKADYKKRNTMRSMTNFDPKHESGEQMQKFEFAYAITTHISQGSQYHNGIYIQEYLFPEMQNRLNYTGITRFSDSCIYVLPYTKRYVNLPICVVSVNGKPVI